MSTDLYVNEVFGPTLQGEGPALGVPAVFLRLAGCNLACVWCDTPYSWDWTRFDKGAEVHRMTTAEVAAEVMAHTPIGPNPLVVVSGGEPMLQQPALAALFSESGSDVGPLFRVHIETAGTKAPIPEWERLVEQFVVSPKLAHSGNPLDKRYVPDALRRLNDTGKAAWKFVVQDVQQLDEVADFVANNYLHGLVYIMPEGATPERLAETGPAIADAVIARGWQFTPRLHIMLWGTKRGV
jgi:7-cyano-7-deazaguanosine (preQ0) biosynthesis protein QueE